MSDRGPAAPRDPSPPDDGGEVRVAKREGRRSRTALLYKSLTLALIAASVGFLAFEFWPKANTARFADAQAGNEGSASANAPAASGEPLQAKPRAAAAQSSAGLAAAELTADTLSRDISEFYVPGQPVPTMGEVIERLNKAGVRSGLGAFSPPGTSPPLVGLAVPADFPLPDGYVRHHQATDDGQAIEAILMFSPDFEFFDAAGRPIPIPENRVVPPQWAPPGLPIRLIEIPRPL
jgi:hypothetical protein